MVEKTKLAIKNEKSNLEKLKDNLFLATQPAVSTENSLDLYQLMHQRAISEGLNFLDYFSSEQLEFSSEFVQSLLFEQIQIILNSDWNPSDDKDFFFTIQKYLFLNNFQIQKLISIHLSQWILSVWDDIFVWISVLIEWRTLLEESFYFRYFYFPIVVRKATEIVENSNFSIQSFVPLLMLETESHSLESLLFENVNTCSIEEAMLIKGFVSHKSFCNFAIRFAEKLLENIADSLFSSTSQAFTLKSCVFSTEMNSQSEILKEWHDLIGCSNMADIVISHFILPFQADLHSFTFGQILLCYQLIRNSLKDCCLSNQHLITELYQTLTVIDSLVK